MYYGKEDDALRLNYV